MAFILNLEQAFADHSINLRVQFDEHEDGDGGGKQGDQNDPQSYRAELPMGLPRRLCILPIAIPLRRRQELHTSQG